MTHIKKIREFINESFIDVTRKVSEKIELSTINVTCTWDGEHWYYYEREDGDFETFATLPNNKNATFEIQMELDFNHCDVEGEYIDDICDIEVLTRLHAYDLAENDFDVETVYCRNAGELSEFLSEFDETDIDNIKELIVDAWEEHLVDDELANEIEDRIGIRQPQEIIQRIKESIIGTVIKNCELG